MFYYVAYVYVLMIPEKEMLSFGLKAAEQFISLLPNLLFGAINKSDIPLYKSFADCHFKSPQIIRLLMGLYAFYQAVKLAFPGKT